MGDRGHTSDLTDTFDAEMEEYIKIQDSIHANTLLQDAIGKLDMQSELESIGTNKDYKTLCGIECTYREHTTSAYRDESVPGLGRIDAHHARDDGDSGGTPSGLAYPPQTLGVVRGCGGGIIISSVDVSPLKTA
nr:hypothetical protein Iba_chr02cCG6320 [Ipomoea batatas]